MDQAIGLRKMTANDKIEKTPLRVLAVTSGKGGVGKTNVTANLATIAAKSGKKVLVIDADLGLANIEVLFGLKPKKHMGDFFAGTASLDEIIIPGPRGVFLLPAGSGVRSLTQIPDHRKMQLVNALDALDEEFDLVLIDTGAGIGDNVLFFVGAAQRPFWSSAPSPHR